MNLWMYGYDMNIEKLFWEQKYDLFEYYIYIYCVYNYF